MPSHPSDTTGFLAGLALLAPPACLALDPAVFRRTVHDLTEELGRAWCETLRAARYDPALRADLVGILERIALVHARHVDGNAEPAAPRARAAAYAAAALLLATADRPAA